jgi:hypothetical protein
MRIHPIVLVCVSLLTIGPVTLTAQQTVPPGGAMVSMSVTMPDGRTEDLTTRESGLGVVQVGGREYGFRPTMHDDAGHRMAVTVFDLGSASESVREIATVQVSGGGSAVATNTTPNFQVRARKRVSPDRTGD